MNLHISEAAEEPYSGNARESYRGSVFSPEASLGQASSKLRENHHMLHRVVFLLNIRYAFAVSVAELCFVDVGTFSQLTIVRGSAFVRE
jgi:hypothetical protein